jgi:hypothetical protein
MKKFVNTSLPNLSRRSPAYIPSLLIPVNIENHLEEITNMTRKALFIFGAVVLSILFSFPILAQEKAQEADGKDSEKVVTYNDLKEQKKAIEELRTSYSKTSADYNAVCKEKEYKTMNDYPKEECEKKFALLSKTYNELKKEVESYNKNVEKFQATSGSKGK